jgi:hypothetical protein
LALLDPNADEEDRIDGALVIAGMAEDIHMLRRAYVQSR